MGSLHNMASEIGESDLWHAQKAEEQETRGAFHAVIKELHHQKSNGTIDENLATTTSFEVIERKENGIPTRDINITSATADKVEEESCFHFVWTILKNIFNPSSYHKM